MKPLHRILMAVEPGKDGVFAVVRDLVRWLHFQHPEIEVDLAYSSCRQLGGADVLAEEVDRHGGDAVDLAVSNAPELGDIAAAAKIRSLVRRRKPQVVHCHSSKAGALCRMLALAGRFPPVIYTPHAYYGVGRAGGGKEALYNGIERFLGRVGITACCSPDEKAFAEEVLHLDPSRLVVVNNGVDTDVFSPASPDGKAALREKLGIPVEGRLLVTIGRDSPQKNYDPLYAALGRVLTPDSDVRFAHAGEGSGERCASLPTTARERSHAFCHLENPQDLLRSADAFILTSLYEGLSLSMLEALSCGLQLILTDAPGLRTIRGMGFDSVIWLPDPGVLTVGDVETAIRQGIANASTPDLKQRDLAIREFDQRRQFGKLVELYREVA